MKKNILTLFIAVCFLSSCNDSNEVGKSSSTNKITLKSYKNIDAPNVIKKSGIQDFRFANKEGKTWQDVAALYAELPTKFSNPLELDVAKGFVAYVILEEYGLLQNKMASLQSEADKYIEVIRDTQYGNPKLYLKILKSVQNRWDKSKIKALQSEFLAICEAEKAQTKANIEQFENKIKAVGTPDADKKVMTMLINQARQSLEAMEELKNL